MLVLSIQMLKVQTQIVELTNGCADKSLMTYLDEVLLLDSIQAY